MLVTEVVAIRESRIATIASHQNSLHSVRLGSCGARCSSRTERRLQEIHLRLDSGTFVGFPVSRKICYQVFLLGLLRPRHGESRTCDPGCSSWQHDRGK